MGVCFQNLSNENLHPACGSHPGSAGHSWPAVLTTFQAGRLGLGGRCPAMLPHEPPETSESTRPFTGGSSVLLPALPGSCRRGQLCHSIVCWSGCPLGPCPGQDCLETRLRGRGQLLPPPLSRPAPPSNGPPQPPAPSEPPIMGQTQSGKENCRGGGWNPI